VSLEEYKRRADISETLYKDVFDKSTDALFITDISLRPVAVNERFVEHSGYTLDDLRGKTLLDIIDEHERQKAIDAFDAQISGNEPGMIRGRIVRKDGSLRETRVWARGVHGIHDMSRAVFCIARDVSEPSEEAQAAPAEDSLQLIEKIREKDSHIEEQARKFQRLADHAKEIVIWLDRDFTCEFVNHGVQRLLGYTSGELLNSKIPWSEIVHPEDYHIVEAWQDAGNRAAIDMEGEIRVYGRSRHMLFLSYRLSIQYDQAGAFSGLDIVAEDITQQKIAEQELRKANRKIQEFNARLTEGVSKKIRALRESEERYKQIVEDSNDIIFSVDTDARMVYMNKKGLRTLQVNPEDISMRPCREFIADDVSERKLQEMIDTIAKGLSPEPFDISIETPDGRKIYHTSLIQIGDPSRVEYACIARDISDEIMKNKKLQLLANIEHFSADAIIGLDTDGNIISWNQGASMMLGWSEEEALGRHSSLIIPEEARAEADEIMAEVMDRGLVRDRETFRKTRDGRTLDVLLTLTALKDSTGRIFGFSAIIKDLTEKKKGESALIQSERLAATGKLSASIAHEINNPLYGIRSCLNHVLNSKKDGIDYQFVRLAIRRRQDRRPHTEQEDLVLHALRGRGSRR
jgi:PAS domain S-box-containing protein